LIHDKDLSSVAPIFDEQREADQAGMFIKNYGGIMNSITNKLGFALAVTLMAGSTGASAEDACHGYSVGDSRDRVLVYVGDVVPMNLATGECGESSSGTEGTMSSECTYTDRDGDRWTSRNTWLKAGATEGGWCEIAGTGKYEKLMGGCGWWKKVRTGPLNAWEFGGRCMLGRLTGSR
jgi:hypothetical protein